MLLVGLIVAVGAYAATQYLRFRCVQPFCPPPPAAASGTPGAALTAFPASMEGFWTGRIHQTGGENWSMELRITEGVAVATVLYRDLDCAGTITFKSAPGGVVRAREHITSGTCTKDGTVTLAVDGAGLDWTYVPDAARYTATGRLSRTRTAPPS
jgi:hypothetical protein